ncbi:MAG: polysaccharide export protein [Nitrospinota bacterium]|nr:polysaccharide export protein [Nitrospinota bacterium]
MVKRKKVIGMTACILTLAFYVQAPHAQTVSLKAQLADKSQYTLGPGDILKIKVFKHKDITGDYRVDGTGNVSFPLVGNIKAEGKTVQQFKESLIEKLKAGYLVNPNVSIEVTNYRPFFILGEVNSPGNFPYQNGMTVINAVALAGGFTNRADKADITITRIVGGKETKIRASLSHVVMPGDTIDVSQRLF